MSKSANNGIDPLNCINQFGCDALRWYLACNTEPGLDLKFNLEELRKESRFINKIYQSARFLAMNNIISDDNSPCLELMDLTHQWQRLILSNRFKQAARLLQRSYTEDFCSGFIERHKDALRTGDEKICLACARQFKHYLSLLHPFIPFITSELHQALLT